MMKTGIYVAGGQAIEDGFVGLELLLQTEITITKRGLHWEFEEKKWKIIGNTVAPPIDILSERSDLVHRPSDLSYTSLPLPHIIVIDCINGK